MLSGFAKRTANVCFTFCLFIIETVLLLCLDFKSYI